MKKEILNRQGFIELIDHMGSDLTVVNSARVSFGKRAKKFRQGKDDKLIKYLAENKHMSPFRHVQFQFHMKCPEALMRQIYKHVVGISWTPQGCPIKDHAWNEISGRYVEYDDVYTPSEFRPQSKDNKQGSEDGDLGDLEIGFGRQNGQGTVRNTYEFAIAQAKRAYRELLDAGVAKEQARLVMPFATFTEVIWTASLEAVAHVIKLRNHEHAQWDVREVAATLHEIVESICPESIKVLI